jgi:poly(A) polymerase
LTSDNGQAQAVFKYGGALNIIRELRRKGHVALFAGGCVRDVLMRRRPNDYDIVTDATPEAVKALFERTIPVGEKFGVVCVMSSGQPFEVATFRTDVDYRDGRRPTRVKYAGAQEDAQRRDFTINGMFYDPVEGKVIDFVGGQKDLDGKIVRAIGIPDERFREDYLRMLRAVRFAANLGFEIESDTMKAVQVNAARITGISAERIREELEKILVDASRARGMGLLDESGLLGHVLPEVAAYKGVKQGKRRHPEGDVWEHTLTAMSKLEEPSFVLAFATLLHDVGKPATADTPERPFLNHERVGEEMARATAARLKLSARETEVTAFLVRHHMILKDVQRMRKSTLKRLLAHDFFSELAELHRVDALASGGDLANYTFAIEAKRTMPDEVVKPAPLVSGDDLAAIGIPRSPAMGRIVKQLYTAQLDEEIRTRDEALDLAKRLLDEAAGRGGAPEAQ